MVETIDPPATMGSEQPLRYHATVGILSIGDMGLGFARLLIAKGYEVVTNAVGRR